jgi:hypothetical protein
MPGQRKAGKAPARARVSAPKGVARHAPGTRSGGLTPAELADRDRRDEIAYALRLSGEYSLQRIADYPDPERPGKTLYSGRDSAAQAWRRACERHACGDTSMSDRRALFEARYETLLRVAWGDAVRGGRGYLFAIDRVLAIMSEMRKMLGVDAPQQVDVNVTATTDFDTEYRRLAESLAARAAAPPVTEAARPQQIEGPPES